MCICSVCVRACVRACVCMQCVCVRAYVHVCVLCVCVCKDEVLISILFLQIGDFLGKRIKEALEHHFKGKCMCLYIMWFFLQQVEVCWGLSVQLVASYSSTLPFLYGWYCLANFEYFPVFSSQWVKHQARVWTSIPRPS